MSTLMGLPLEIRNKILGQLLPDLAEIKVFDGYYDSFVHLHLGWDGDEKDDNNIAQRIASTVQYRDDGARCHTAVLRVNHQLYVEGTAIMYNRAFLAVITARGITFLKYHFSSSKWSYYCHVLGPGDLRCFPFHMAKQVQIEFWATDFKQQEGYLYDALLDFCLVLCDKPSLRDVRVDLYDRSYRPKPVLKDPDRMTDNNGPHPPQAVFRGGILNGPFQRTEEEVEFWGHRVTRDWLDRDVEPWERANGRVLEFWRHAISRLTLRGLEAALEPLKLLSNVGRATVNLTPGTQNDQVMMAVGKKLQDSMMHKGLRHEVLPCRGCALDASIGAYID